MKMILSQEQIDESYCQNWQVTGNNKYKVIIGQGGFGKIRLSFVLINNKTSETMKVGQIICVKKTRNFQNNIENDFNVNKGFKLHEIIINSWNYYSAGEVGKLIFSPTIYDLRIIEKSSPTVLIYLKGYIMQEFKPVFDGSKAFQPGQIYHNQWFHQKKYFLSIFSVISKLLNRGFCMTDIKPENTLYDGENNRGMLIDLAGVIRKSSRSELEQCKIKYVKEVSMNFIAPEIKTAIKQNDSNTEIDLCKFNSYSMGIVLKKIVLKHINKDNNYINDLKILFKSLTKKNPKERISIEGGLATLIKIGEDLIL